MWVRGFLLRVSLVAFILPLTEIHPESGCAGGTLGQSCWRTQNRGQRFLGLVGSEQSVSHLCKGFGCDPGTQNRGQCFLGLMGGERSVSKGFGCDPGAVKM